MSELKDTLAYDLSTKQAGMQKHTMSNQRLLQLKKHNQALSARLQKKVLQVPNQEQLLRNLEALYRYAEENGIVIEQFLPKRQKPLHFLLRQAVTLKLYGQQTKLLRFLQEIEGQMVFTTLYDFVLKPVQGVEDGAKVRMVLHFSIYQSKDTAKTKLALQVQPSFLMPIKGQMEQPLGLKAYPYKKLAFVGMMQSARKTQVLIKTPDNEVIAVGIGAYIGKEKVLVTAIKETFVVLQYKDGRRQRFFYAEDMSE